MSAKNIVQFVVIRGDLSKVQNWPSGAIIAQACHACVAVIHKHYSDPDTQAYLHDIENMHKIVLEVPDETGLCHLADQLGHGGVPHVLWREQPEDVATCLAVKPCPKATVSKYMRIFKLYPAPPQEEPTPQ